VGIDRVGIDRVGIDRVGIDRVGTDVWAQMCGHRCVGTDVWAQMCGVGMNAHATEGTRRLKPPTRNSRIHAAFHFNSVGL
jgi:hypothetical protein